MYDFLDLVNGLGGLLGLFLGYSVLSLLEYCRALATTLYSRVYSILY